MRAALDVLSVISMLAGIVFGFLAWRERQKFEARLSALEAEERLDVESRIFSEVVAAVEELSHASVKRGQPKFDSGSKLEAGLKLIEARFKERAFRFDRSSALIGLKASLGRTRG